MACEKTTRDLLDQVRDFHKQLSDFYAQKADIANDERVTMLLDYMSRHEMNLEKCLAEYEVDAPGRVLDTWFRFTPDIAECKCFDRIELTPDMTIDDIIETAMWFDDCLIEVYKTMAERSVSQNVRELFDNLVQLEQNEKRSALRSTQEIEQM